MSRSIPPHDFRGNLVPLGLTLVLALFSFTGCVTTLKKHPRALIKTEAGNIEVELFSDRAPATVGNFLGHAKDGHYRNGAFYRVVRMDNQLTNPVKIEVIQGGVGRNGRPPQVQHEPTNITGVRHRHGTISMARNEPGTATTEFFICLGDQPGLDFGGRRKADGQGFAAFGRVIKGIDVVQKIHSNPAPNSLQILPRPLRIFDIVPHDENETPGQTPTRQPFFQSPRQSGQ